jgi:Protein of unknown function (DUF2933)
MRVPAPPEPSASQQPTVPSRHLWRLVGGYLVIGAGLAAVVSLWLPWIHFEAPTPAMLPDDLPPPNYMPPPFVPAVMLGGSSAQVMALQLAPYALLLLCGLMQLIGRGRLRVLSLAVLGFPLSFLGLVVSVYYAHYALSNEISATSGLGPPSQPS